MTLALNAALQDLFRERIAKDCSLSYSVSPCCPSVSLLAGRHLCAIGPHLGAIDACEDRCTLPRRYTLTTLQCCSGGGRKSIHQQPPAAPLNTMIGVGTGRYDGIDGHTVKFTLIDGGEPGRNDKIAILIYKTATPGTVVLSLPLTPLTDGNLHAHPDQH